jgi:hypothetical protein
MRHNSKTFGEEIYIKGHVVTSGKNSKNKNDEFSQKEEIYAHNFVGGFHEL